MSSNPIPSITSIVVSYLETEEYHKQVALGLHVESAICTTLGLPIPKYIIAAQGIASVFFRDYNRSLTERAVAHQPRSPETLQYQKQVWISLIEIAQKVINTSKAENRICTFIGPGTLERPTFKKIQERFKVTLIDHDLAPVQALIKEMPTKEGFKLLPRDLTMGLWLASMGKLFQIEQNKEQELLHLAKKRPKPSALELVEPIVRATHAAFDAMTKMISEFSTNPSEDDLELLDGEKADYMVSLNISSEMTSLLISVIDERIKVICPYAFNDDGIFKIDPTLKQKFDAYDKCLTTLKEKAIVRYLTVLKASTKPSGCILFGETMEGVEHAVGDITKVVSAYDKFPKSINFSSIFPKVEELKPLIWPQTLINYKGNLGRAFSWRVKLFVFKTC